MKGGIDLTKPMGAIFSEDEKYRYALWRVWNPTRQPLLFIGLNPSTANGLSNDPTITRLMVRAARAGYGAILAANLYAVVSSNPKILLTATDAVGPENDEYLKSLIALSGRVLCGWGSFKAATARARSVLQMVAEPYCLGVNSDGHPKHPLYISYDTEMRLLSGAIRCEA